MASIVLVPVIWWATRRFGKRNVLLFCNAGLTPICLIYLFIPPESLPIMLLYLFGAVMAFAAARYASMGWIDSIIVAPSYHFTYAYLRWIEPVGGHLGANLQVAIIVALKWLSGGAQHHAACLGWQGAAARRWAEDAEFAFGECARNP